MQSRKCAKCSGWSREAVIADLTCALAYCRICFRYGFVCRTDDKAA